MGQVLHGCATTTEAVRRAIQASLRAHQRAHEEFRAAPSLMSANAVFNDRHFGERSPRSV
jgi:hypothetical protein